MSNTSASAFVIWRDWMSGVLASVRQQIESAAIRHSKIGGASITSTLIFVRTAQGGVTSGCFTVMERGPGIEVSPGAHELLSFLTKLPESVRSEIIKGIKL